MGSIGFLRSMLVLALAIIALLCSDLWLKTGIWFEILREVGIAFLVSVIIWSVFELYRAGITEAEWTERIDRVTKNVFLAVLQKDLPKELIDTAQKLALNTSLIRSEFSVIYKFTDRHAEVDNRRIDFVIIEASVRYVMRNVSSETVQFSAAFHLPNPMHRITRKHLCVKCVEVRKPSAKTLQNIGFEAAQREFNAMRDKADGTQNVRITFKPLDVPLEPGETLSVEATYDMVKNQEDSELLQTGCAANGLSVLVLDSQTGSEVGDSNKRTIFAQSVHPEDLQKGVVSGGNLHKINGYLLPHQGILFWWKMETGDGKREEQLGVDKSQVQG